MSFSHLLSYCAVVQWDWQHHRIKSTVLCCRLSILWCSNQRPRKLRRSRLFAFITMQPMMLRRMTAQHN